MIRLSHTSSHKDTMKELMIHLFYNNCRLVTGEDTETLPVEADNSSIESSDVDIFCWSIALHGPDDKGGQFLKQVETKST